MNKKVSKNIKPFIMKAVVVTMTICCVFGPLRNEIHKVLHAIVHSLEKPDYIISHQDRSTKKTDIVKIHESDEHKSITIRHDHEYIELVEKVFEESDQGSNPTDSHLGSHKINKHIRFYESDDPETSMVLSLEILHSYFDIEKRINKGYLNDLNKPPEMYRDIVFS